MILLKKEEKSQRCTEISFFCRFANARGCSAADQKNCEEYHKRKNKSKLNCPQAPDLECDAPKFRALLPDDIKCYKNGNCQIRAICPEIYTALAQNNYNIKQSEFLRLRNVLLNRIKDFRQ